MGSGGVCAVDDVVEFLSWGLSVQWTAEVFLDSACLCFRLPSLVQEIAFDLVRGAVSQG